MTRDDIIKMAREADIIDFRDDDSDHHVKQMLESLERFAALVAQAEREACAEVAKSNWTSEAEKRYGFEISRLIADRGKP